jgi:hypothetical protein
MPSTLSDITKGLEQAVSSVASKKVALDEARKIAAEAEKVYLDSLAAVKSFHEQYSSFMKDVLTGFGQLHS